jgi:hypothetical protein
MSGVQRNTFLAVLPATTISTLLACSTLSADVKVPRNQANAGDVEAQCQLGVMYANGEGVPQDYQVVSEGRRARIRGCPVQPRLDVFKRFGRPEGFRAIVFLAQPGFLKNVR